MAKVPDPLEKKATAAPVAFFKAEESVFFRKSHSPEQHAGNESGELAFLSGRSRFSLQKHASKQHAGNESGKMGCMIGARLHHSRYNGNDRDR